MTVYKKPSDNFIVIRSPLDIQGTLLIYLRSLFRARVVNNLYWDPDITKATVHIEVADKITQEKLNLRPAIFLNLGQITISSISGTADTLQHSIKAKLIDDAGKEQIVPTGRVTTLLLSFPMEVAVYSSKTESYNIAYKLSKLMLAFKQSLERYSNIYQIEQFSITPPQFINGMEAEVYKSTFRFAASFYDVSNIVDVAPLLKHAYLVGTNGSDPNDTANYEIDMWADSSSNPNNNNGNP